MVCGTPCELSGFDQDNNNASFQPADYAGFSIFGLRTSTEEKDIQDESNEYSIDYWELIFVKSGVPFRF